MDVRALLPRNHRLCPNPAAVRRGMRECSPTCGRKGIEAMKQTTPMERLDKAIAARTAFSRREVHALAARGLVLVNGEKAKNCSAKVGEADEVTVDGTVLSMAQYTYIMMNKPRGVVCATEDKLTTVIDLLPPELLRTGLFPAGRLDKDTEGFVLVTNDGELSHRILSPKSHVPKTYLAHLDGPLTEEVIETFAKGVVLSPQRPREGAKELVCLPASVSRVEGDPQAGRVILRQGMYHQVKRMFAAFGLEVTALYRERIGGLSLDSALESGACRLLTADEVALLERGDGPEGQD